MKQNENTKIFVSNLNVYYGKNLALNNVNLEIPKNQITVILGPSGCGKTTLLKSFNRFLELNDTSRVTGKIIIDNQDIYSSEVDVTEVRKSIGLLAQHPYPLPMSIYENVAHGMRIHRLKTSKIELDKSVQHYLEVAGLWNEVRGRLREPATGLSIGQQQRLCLARGLAVEPEVILGDEPTSALDPISSQHIEKILVGLKSNYTLVMVTHILRQAKRLADYVVFMYMGEIIEVGPAEDFFNNPKETRTREYINGVF